MSERHGEVVDSDEEWCKLTVNNGSIQGRAGIVPQVEFWHLNFDQSHIVRQLAASRVSNTDIPDSH